LPVIASEAKQSSAVIASEAKQSSAVIASEAKQSSAVIASEAKQSGQNPARESFHSGSMVAIKEISLALDPPGICFSRAMAARMSGVVSKYTSFERWCLDPKMRRAGTRRLYVRGNQIAPSRCFSQ
jgi:hypothetical protein